MDGGCPTLQHLIMLCLQQKGKFDLRLSALMMHCIFLEGYKQAFARRAPGVRLGGEFRMCIKSLESTS